MDIRMPVMDGYQATRTIRAMERADAKTIALLALTANTFPADIQRCLSVGMKAHRLPKPLRYACGRVAA